MSHQSKLIASDILGYLDQHQRKEMLRLLTCGSVDDGKSTLIGRLLYESKMIYEDQIAAIKRDTAKHGTTGEELDLALFLDGLEDEQQQGITIDVAYRYFSTDKRKFIIADCPGHEQYTRNMATGASTADLAIILIDARKGVLVQTKRHSFIVSLLGIKHVLVAVNKMDLVDFSEDVFEKIKRDYRDFSVRLDLPDVHFLPISALKGDNVVERSNSTPWYDGSTLMGLLENVEIGSDRNFEDFRFPVQYVNRPNLDFRGFAGTVASGIIRKGDEVMALPSRKTSRVKSIVTYDGNLDEAFASQAVTLTLEDEIDVARGDMLVRPGNVPRVDHKIEATIVWMHEDKLVPGKQYWFKQGTKVAPGTVSAVRYQIDVNTLHRKDAEDLPLNAIGRCQLMLTQPIPFDAYKRNRATGGFIVIDRMTNLTVGAGMILDRSSGDSPEHWDDQSQTKESQAHSAVTIGEREKRLGQKPATVLLTGLTGSGKTTIGFAVERRLFELGKSAVMLDGQQMRRAINKDLGFTSAERSENLRRSAEVARLFNDTGMIVVAGFLAPDEAVRNKAGELVGRDRWIVVHLDCPVEVCRTRDTDGHYKLADSGEIANFPGVSAPFDPPVSPDLVLKTATVGIQDCVNQIVDLLVKRGIVG